MILTEKKVIILFKTEWTNQNRFHNPINYLDIKKNLCSVDCKFRIKTVPCNINSLNDNEHVF